MEIKINLDTLEKFVTEAIPREYEDRYGRDEKFVFWFLKAQLMDDENKIAEAVVGGPGDKCVDAVYIDDKLRKVYVIQGKFRENLGGKTEPKKEMREFSELSETMENDKKFKAFLVGLRAEVRERIIPGRKLIKENNFEPIYYYVTTAKIEDDFIKKIKREFAEEDRDRFNFVDSRQIKLLAEDYLCAFVPGVESVVLKYECGGNKMFSRQDELGGLKTEAWILSVPGEEIARIVEEHSFTLFNRNVRGFLGKGRKVNKAIAETIKNHPSRFWYYNNGITMICTDADFEKNDEAVYIKDPQIINGQQTAKILESLKYAEKDNMEKVRLLLRLIKIGSTEENRRILRSFIKEIVKSSNWQNAVSLADLVANEPEQVYIERVLKPYGYYYLRRKMLKTEANLRGARRLIPVVRDDLGKAIAVTEFDPSFAKSKEMLYGDEYYDKIFRQEEAEFYLVRYLLMVLVKEAARRKGGDYTRASWATLAYIWHDLGSFLVGDNATRFIVANKKRGKKEEQKGNTLELLIKVAESVVESLVEFFRYEEGRAKEAGDKAPNIADFLRQADIVTKFEVYFSKKLRSDKDKYISGLEKFKKRLEGEPVN